MRTFTASIDWTAYNERPIDRSGDPFESLHLAKPYRERPSGALAEYAGSRLDLFTIYLPRRGVGLNTQVKAYICGQTKILETDKKVYITGVDGLVYERCKSQLTGWKQRLIW